MMKVYKAVKSVKNKVFQAVAYTAAAVCMVVGLTVPAHAEITVPTIDTANIEVIGGAILAAIAIVCGIKLMKRGLGAA